MKRQVLPPSTLLFVGGCCLLMWIGYNLKSNQPSSQKDTYIDKLSSFPPILKVPLRATPKPSPQAWTVVDLIKALTDPALGSKDDEPIIQNDQAMLILFLDELASQIDPIQAKRMFQQSGFDTAHHLQVALGTLASSYPITIDRRLVERKVLAIQMLKFAQGLTADICLKTLAIIASHLESSSPQATRLLMFDSLELGRICFNLDRDTFLAFVANIQSSKLQSQLLLVTEDESW